MFIYLATALNMSIENIIVILFAFLLMFWLFWKDISSYKGDNHQDFKSILVSTGVLGTFIGIFIGLLGFDSNSVADSVPKLLDGLKTAFITSIVGMALAILLSIIQKKKNGDSAENEIVALNNISKQLEKLNSIDDKLISLDVIKKNVEILPLINTNIKSLSSDVSSVKDELKVNQKDLFEFLKEKLSQIDNSLKEAVKTLSKGATEEIINALQSVIKDFNNNLTEQFGDNFKQLNEAVLKMIEWQNNYKNSVQEFEKQLKITAENTSESHQNTAKLITDFAKTNLKNLQDFVEVNNQALLVNIEKINTATTKNTDELITKVHNFSDEINDTLRKNVEHTQNATSAIETNAKAIDKMTKSYAKIADTSQKLEVVITTNQNQIQNLEQHLKAFAQISDKAKGVTKELKTFSNEVQGSLTNQAQALSELTKAIEEQLPKSLKTLNESLTSLTKQFSKDYESFLKQIAKLMKANNIN
jgi:ABC-type transporter Mla subunit MlaD